MDEDVPIVATSKHVIVNKITAADDYLKLIKPTPLPSPVFETNTYYSTVDFSKIINEDDTTRTINKQDVITQVIVTESLPLGRSPNTKNIHSSNVDVENEDLEPSNYDDIDLLNNIRKTHIMENNPTRIEHVPDRTAMPLHIYATKTYMTTFTYFTTLLQNKDKKSSTLVNSNTKVIENVITESIPSSLIPSHVLTSISKSLINNDKYTKKDLKTLITLKNGQKLEITAANILRPADMSTSTKVLSFDDENDLEVAANNLSPIQALHSSEEAENFVESSSEEIAVEDEEPPPNKFVGSNNNRITNKTVASPAGNIGTGAVKFPNLLGGINMNGFSALGPVINAMAGLLQNNFGSNVKTNKVKAKVPQILQAVHALPLVAQAPPQFNKESEAIILKQSEAKNKYPLYIPVRGQGKYPAGHQNQFPPMMGSGIHISPGEVITANSDVIIGKPAVIGPKLPQNLEQPAATEQVPIGMQPPPFVPLQGNVNQRKPSFVKDIKNPVAHHQAQGQKNDDYYGPVPPREVSQNIHHQAIPVNSLPRAPLPQNLQKIQPNIPPQIRPTPELNQYNKFAQHDIQNYQQQQPAQRPNNNILIPRPQESNVGSNHGHFLKNNQNQNELNRDPSSHRLPQRQRPHQSSLNNYHGHGHHSHHNSHHNNHPLSIPIQSQASINFGGNSQNIIEIQKIPAVFSADLPPVAVPNRNNYYNQENSDHGIVTHNLPEIQDNSNGHPLLVDIQPSQVAKVLIPHGSSSVLVFGGVTEAHKSGQYFNDPPPYANEEIGIKSVNILADVSSKDKIILQNHNSIKNHGIQSIPSHTNTATYNVEDNIIVASEKQNLSPDLQPVAAYHGTAQEVNHNPVLSIHSQIINGSPATIHNIQPNVDNQQVDVISGQVIHYKPNTSEDHRRPQANPSVSMNVQPAPYFVGSSHHQQSHQSAPHNQPSHLQLQQQMFNKQKQLDHQQKVQYENQMKQFEHQQRLNYENQMKQNYEKHQQRIQFEHHMKKQADNQKRAQFERAQLENLKKQKQAEHQQRLNYELQMKQNHDKQQQNRHEYENQMKQNFDKQQKIHLEQHLKQQYEEQIKQKPPQSNIHSNNIPAFEIGPGYTDVHFVAHDRPSIDVIMQHHPIPVKAADQGSHISGQPQHQQLYKIQDLAHNHQEVVYANRPQPNYASNHEQTYHNSKPSEIPEDEDENESDGDGHVVQESMLHPILPSQEPAPSKEQDIQLNDFNREEIKSSTEKQVTTTTQWPRRETIRTTPKAPSTTQRPVHYVHTTLAPVVHKPVFITTVYPHLNYQFDNLPNLVNGLSPGQPFARPTESPRRPVFKQPQVTDNKFINSISHAMQPPPIIPLPLPKNNKRIIVPSVPVFGTKKPNLFKISMPINPMPENINNNANNQQTEEPFNPKYTKGVQYSSMFTTQTPPAKTSTQKQIVSSTTISPSTSQSPKSTEKSPSIYQLNLGEIQHNKGKPSVDEAPDIFDIKESNNPLNLDYVKHTDDEDSELMPPTINKPYQTISRKPTSSETPPTAQHKFKDQTGSSSELDNMKPPHTVSRGTRPPLSKLPSIDDIINLRAPPTTSSTHPARTENAEKSRQQPSYVNIRRPSTASTPNTTQLNRVSSTTAKPRVQWPNLKNNGPKDLASYIKIFEEKQKTTYKLPEQTTADSNEESHHVSVNPQDVFILGSEYELTDRSTIKPTPTLIRGRTSVKEMIPSVVSVPIESTSDQSAIVHNTQQVTPNLSQNDDRKLVLNRTKSFIERDSKITTKYITNTKTITLAKTKTEVINRSHGQFVTTRTSTIYDTITLTETETLLKSSIQPSPAHSSTSMQSTTMQQSTPKIIEVEGIFSEDDLDLDEFIINYEENKSENTITKVNSKEEEDRLKNRHPDENESIFVVMTDKKKNGLINLDPSIIKAPMSKEESTESDTNINEVVDVSRDEEDSNDGADHVLLGGILIASPTHSDKTKFNIINNQCIPDCRGTKNEVCQKLDGSMRCVCRPGFARMFPDRPCKRKSE